MKNKSTKNGHDITGWTLYNTKYGVLETSQIFRTRQNARSFRLMHPEFNGKVVKIQANIIG